MRIVVNAVLLSERTEAMDPRFRGDDVERAKPDYPPQARRNNERLASYSAAISSGAVRGRMICTRVPLPGSECRCNRPPSRLVTML